MEKIRKIQQYLNENDSEVAFINNPHHIAYLTGFVSEPHERLLMLVIGKDAAFIFTPALDMNDAAEATGLKVYGYLDEESPWDKIAEAAKENGIQTNLRCVEKNYLTVERNDALSDTFGVSEKTCDITPYLQEMMLIKTANEIEKMIEAGQLADYALKIGFEALAVGKTEAEIVAEIEYELKKKGVSEMSFGTLVLAGSHAASPHGTPGERTIQPNEFVLFDLGVVHRGYTSDVTRTVSFGEVSETAKEVYGVVLRAQQAAIAAIRPGITAGELDAIARNIITEAGYGEYFIHRLGHGLGSSVHEFPSIMSGSDFVIREGMCFSIEPGIYIPDEVGVRIEDCVYVTENGCEVLTHTPTDLLYVDIK